MAAYEDMLRHTSTTWAPWYIIPADHKWFVRVAVAGLIAKALEGLKLRYPVLSAEKLAELKTSRRMLMREKPTRRT